VKFEYNDEELPWAVFLFFIGLLFMVSPFL
jgi:hypothetical protein